jgi:hypothetical protein
MKPQNRTAKAPREAKTTIDGKGVMILFQLQKKAG